MNYHTPHVLSLSLCPPVQSPRTHLWLCSPLIIHTMPPMGPLCPSLSSSLCLPLSLSLPFSLFLPLSLSLSPALSSSLCLPIPAPHLSHLPKGPLLHPPLSFTLSL